MFRQQKKSTNDLFSDPSHTKYICQVDQRDFCGPHTEQVIHVGLFHTVCISQNLETIPDHFLGQ